MNETPKKVAIITIDSTPLSLIALIAASQQINSIPVTTTLIDTIPDDEWNDERVGEWNINAGKQAEINNRVGKDEPYD